MSVRVINSRKERKKYRLNTLADFKGEEKPASRKLSTISKVWATSKEKILKEILKGYGSVLDISGGRQISFNPRRLSDADRLRGDWKRVGDDMRIAFIEF